MQMNDFLGNLLSVGDEVVFTSYNEHGLTRGKIISFSKALNMAVIEYNRPVLGLKKTRKTSGYIVKVV